ncbi:MAG: fibronectin type III domain-containing protein [Candidatus Aminicenantes bacterium]|nr:fibronectin type III domain-containing protein [Candidatus Aminicenantes bacterium]
MKKKINSLLLSFVLLTLFSCGRKGPILPPLIRIPQPIVDLEARQIGEKIFLQWKNSMSYTDDSPLTENREVEIWLFSADKYSDDAKRPPGKDDFDSRAELLKTLGMVHESSDDKEEKDEEESLSLPVEFKYKLKEKESFTKVYIFSLRIKDGRKISVFSDVLTFMPEVVSQPPINLRAEVFEDRIELSWDAPKTDINQSSRPVFEGYNLYRRSEEDKARKRNSTPLKKNFFEEKSFEFGTGYSFFVRTSYLAGASPFESADSNIVEVKPVDIFPPKAPSALISIAGSKLISLSWESNKENDLAGYRIWRRLEGESDFSLLTSELFLESNFNDTKLEKGRKYEYTLTAVDKNGNESERSSTISIRFRDVLP